MRIFICDNCSRQFNQPLDEEMYKDKTGNWHTLDLCAPCRKLNKDSETKSKQDFFEKLVNKEK